MKKCRHCKETKSISDFSRNKSYRDGYFSTCKACRKSKYPTTLKQKQQAYERQIKRNYGITVDDYEKMYLAQNGLCAGCSQPNAGSKFHIDHCHASGKVRGLLCANCNIALGLLNDSIKTLSRLIEYLV
jgi:hypothetical protein